MQIRKEAKWLFLAVFLVVLSHNQRAVAETAKRTNRPNVVLILTDDQGSVDVNCYGSKDLYTPNMDKLAERGVRFTQFYVGAPVCSPSRAAILTGRYPQRAQLASNAYGAHGMPASQFTIAEMMKTGDYKTALFGKWHVGETLPMSPNAQGFDEFLGHKVGCIDNYSHYFYWVGPNRHDLWKNEQEYYEEGSYFPDMTVREATRFIEENKDDPFFLFLTFNMPHYPLQPQAKYREMYKDMEDQNRMRYGAFVSTVDEKIGKVVDKLDDLGIRDNTIVIFLSDHGHSEEERTFGGGGSAGPYRGHKFLVWEGGIRVPCIMSWPGHFPENEVRDQMVASIDIYPTVAKYCGVDLPDRIIDGMDISSVIESGQAESPRKTMHWELGGRWAVHDGDWKLVSDEGLFLSDLSKDVTETKNIADQHPDIVERLKQMHEDWKKTNSVQ